MLSDFLLAEILREIPCREHEIEVLHALLFHAHPSQSVQTDVTRDDRAHIDISLPGLLVYGPPQTGKTLVLRALLEASDEHQYVYIDCRKCVSARSLYEHTIDELLGRDLLVDDDGRAQYEGHNIDTLSEFLNVLERTLTQQERQQRVNTILVRLSFNSPEGEGAYPSDTNHGRSLITSPRQHQVCRKSTNHS